MNLKQLLYLKFYWETGTGVTSTIRPLFYLSSVFAGFTEQFELIVFLGIFYTVFTFVIGYFWVTKDIMKKEVSIRNQENPEIMAILHK